MIAAVPSYRRHLRCKRCLAPLSHHQAPARASSQWCRKASLKSITIPHSVTSIGDYAFYNASSFKDVYYYGTKSDWEKITKGKNNDPLLNAQIHYREPAVIVVKTGKCGADLVWSLDENGTLTITGTGAMDDWSDTSKRPWLSYVDSIKSVVVEEDVTTVGAYAFMGCDSLVNVTLPKSLKEIAYCAFQSCNNIGKINIPEGVETVDVWAFAECKSLEKITFPSSLKTLRAGACLNCTKLKSVTINEELLKSLTYDPFENCPDLVFNFVSYDGDYTYKKVNPATNGTGTVKVVGVVSSATQVTIPASISLAESRIR